MSRLNYDDLLRCDYVVYDELMLVKVNFILNRDSWCDWLWCLNLCHCRSGWLDFDNWLNCDDELGHCDRRLRLNFGRLLRFNWDCLLRFNYGLRFN